MMIKIICALPDYIKRLLDAVEGDERFVLTLGCGVVSSILFASGTLSESGWLTVVTLTVGAYITGKVTENISAANNATKVAVANGVPSVQVSGQP